MASRGESTSATRPGGPPAASAVPACTPRPAGWFTARWRRWLPHAALIALAGLAYVNADHDVFLFDSAELIPTSPHLDNLADAVAAVFLAPLALDEGLSHASFAFSRAVNEAVGTDPLDVTGFLVFNVVVHAVNSLLIFALVRRILCLAGAGRGAAAACAWLAAAWFAVHPIQASSVAYIAQRRGAMAATFYLLGVLAFLKARAADTSTTTRLLSAVAVAICYWLCIRCKSMGLTLPAMLLIVECCLRAGDAAALKRFVRWAGPCCVLLPLGGLVVLWRMGIFDVASFELRGYSAAPIWDSYSQLLTSARAMLHYWKLLILPLPQWSSIDHALPISTGLAEHGAGPALLLHTALILLAVAAVWRGAILGPLGILWFYVALLPYAIVPQADVMVEYKTYLASAGGAIIVAAIALHLRALLGVRGARVAAAGLICALLTTTLLRNRIYQNAVNLWTDALAKYPNNLRAHIALGAAYHGAGQSVKAIERFQIAVRMKPDFAEAHFDLANLYVTAGRRDEAVPHYQQVVRLEPEHGPAHYNLACLLSQRGQSDDAARHFRRAIEIRPAHAAAHNNLANLLLDQGRRDEAVHHLERAIDHDPGFAVAHVNLANVHAAAGRSKEAAGLYRKALEIDPGNDAAREGLAALKVSP